MVTHLLVLLVLVVFITHHAHGLQKQTVLCTNGHLIVAQETDNGVKVTAKSSVAHSGTQQEIVFGRESLPEECGKARYNRCNLTVLTSDDDDPQTKIAVAVPLARGVGLVGYNLTTEVGIRYHDHVVLDLEQSIPSYDCVLTTFFKVSTLGLSNVLGLCLNTSEEEQSNIRFAVLNVVFSNLTQSSLSACYESAVITLDFPKDISQAVYFQEPAFCFIDGKRSVFFIDGTLLIEFNFATGIVGYYEMFEVQNSVPSRFDCVHPKQLVRISDNILVAYCENVTVEMDLCERRSVTILVNTYHEPVEGMRFYCNSDLTTYLNIQGGIVTARTTGSTSHLFSNPLTLPSDIIDNGIHSANCLITSEGQFLLVISSANGETHLINLQEGYSVRIGESDLNESDTTPHTVYYDHLVLFNDRLHSRIHNLSCQNDHIRIDHPYHLSAYIQDDKTLYPCTCTESGYVTGTVHLDAHTTNPMSSDLSTHSTRATETASTATHDQGPGDVNDGTLTANLYITLAALLGFLGGMVVCLVCFILVLFVMKKFANHG